MNGDFKTDITRDSFRRHKNFSRVLMQQGRVQLDADWNEQTDILLYYVRSLASDIIGPHAGPIGDVGFAIGKYTPPPPSKSAISDSGSKGGRTRRSKGSDQQATDSSVGAYTVSVTRGHYYVDGILCELNENIEQYVIEDEEVDAAKSAQNNTSSNQFQNAFLFYLDVWEREVTYQEDDSIREVALGGPDTATRAQVVSQVRAKALASLGKLIIDDTQKRQGKLEGLLGQQPVKASGDFTDAWTDFVQKYAHMFPAMTSALPPNILQLGPAYLKARTLIPEGDEYTDPCTIPPASKYRGAENQLYRAEVHTSGIGRPNPNQPQQGRIQGRQSSNQAGGRDSEPPQKGDSRPASGSQYATFKWSRENGSVVFPITSNIDPGTFDTLTVSISDLGRDDSRFSLNVDDWVEILDYEDTLELEPGNLCTSPPLTISTCKSALRPPKARW